MSQKYKSDVNSFFFWCKMIKRVLINSCVVIIVNMTVDFICLDIVLHSDKNGFRKLKIILIRLNCRKLKNH